MKTYTTEQREAIIKRAKSIGTTAAAKENNVPYSTVLKWLKDEGVLVSVDLEIKVKENEIVDLGDRHHCESANSIAKILTS